MSFMNRFKKPEEPDENVDLQQNEQPEEPGIDLDPQPEKAKRINKMVIYGVGVVLILAVAFTLRSCGGSSSPKKDQIQSSPGEIITETDLKKAEADSKNKKNNAKQANKNNNAQANLKGQNGKDQNLPNGTEYVVDENGNTRAVRNNTRTSTPSRTSTTSSSNGANVTVSSTSAPAPLTPYQKYQNDSQDAYYKRQLQDEQNAYREEKQAQRSDIFFDMTDRNAKKAGSDKNRNSYHETAANSYYNDGVIPDSDSNENNFQDDYIQVIGRGSKR